MPSPIPPARDAQFSGPNSVELIRFDGFQVTVAEQKQQSRNDRKESRTGCVEANKTSSYSSV